MSYSQSVAYTVMMKLFLAGTATPATGKTPALVISKAGAGFGNPSAGAATSTEVSNGWYSYALTSTDMNTIGDTVVRMTAAGCDDSERILPVAVPSPTLSAIVSGVWAALNTDLTGAGSIGASIVSFLTGYTAAPTAATVRAEMDTNSTKLAAAATQTTLLLVKAKSDLLPADPTSETNATANKSSIISGVWSVLTSALTSPGTIGAALLSFLTGYVAAPTVEAVRSEMDTNSTKLTDIDNKATTIANETSGSGNGSNVITFTVTDTSNNRLQKAVVTAKINGAVRGTGSTDADGNVDLHLNDADYVISITCVGFNGTGGPLTVSGDDDTPAYSLAPFVATPSTSGQGTGYVYYTGQSGPILNIVTGDSFTSATGRSLKTNLVGQDGLIGCTAHLRIAGIDLAVSDPVMSGTQQVVFRDVASSLTTGLRPASAVPYQVRYELNGAVVTTVTATANIVKGV